MRVGVYIDGYNLYCGGRGLCGRSTPGWRWLDLKWALAYGLIATHSRWQNPIIETVTYRTARLSGASNPVGEREQDIYLRALERFGSATQISYGSYVARFAKAPLATAGRNGKPVISHPQWPLMVQDGAEQDVFDARFMTSVARREEKVSDVNGKTQVEGSDTTSWSGFWRTARPGRTTALTFPWLDLICAAASPPSARQALPRHGSIRRCRG